VFKNISGIPETKGVTLTGGEPLLRRDAAQIARSAFDAGLKVAVATNGTLLNKTAISELVNNGVQHFDIGFTDPGRETRLALASAVNSSCSVTASICLHGLNHRRTGMLTSMAAAFGADSIAINRFIPTGRAIRTGNLLQLQVEDLLSALEMANQTAISTGIHIYTGVPIEPCIASNKDFPGISFSTCRCGETKWAIDHRGNLRTCEQSSKMLGNLLEESLEDILKRNAVEIMKFRQWRPTTGCESCARNNDCFGGCRFQTGY